MGLQQKEVIKTDKASLRVEMCAILQEGKGPGFGELGGCAGTVFWEEALSEPLCREVFWVEVHWTCPKSASVWERQDFQQELFFSVQTSGCLSETSLLLSLRCIYEHQRVCYIPSLPENESLWLNISLCTKVFYSWKLSGFVLFPLPFSLSLPFCKRRLLLTNQMGWFAQLWALFCL